MDAYHTVYRGGSGEIVEKKSRFIAEVFPVTSEEEAMQYLEEARKRYWDARHHCWAYVLGRNPSAERMSDDGEPAGTAGKPILEVIRGRQITDVLVIVTRYFGGTLLGTGGLVKAYGDAVREVLRTVETEEIVRRTGFSILTGYEFYDRIRRALPSYDISGLEEDFGEGIRIRGEIAETQKEAFDELFSSLTMGRASLSWK